jgi:hypothetical protein
MVSFSVWYEFFGINISFWRLSSVASMWRSAKCSTSLLSFKQLVHTPSLESILPSQCLYRIRPNESCSPIGSSRDLNLSLNPGLEITLWVDGFKIAPGQRTNRANLFISGLVTSVDKSSLLVLVSISFILFSRFLRGRPRGLFGNGASVSRISVLDPISD